MTHTPGRWHVHEYGHPIVFDEARLKTADCNSLRPKAENVANAHLIATAPDLLEAARLQEEAETRHANCEECEGAGVPELCPVCFPFFDDARVKRRLAIAKAEQSK